MTDAEMFGCFDQKYNSDWVPELHLPVGKKRTDREYFDAHCRANCVTNPDTIAALWETHKGVVKGTLAALKAAAAKARPQPRKRYERPGGTRST